MLRLLFAAALLLLPVPASADKAHDTLKVALTRQLESLDPYRTLSREAMAVSAMLFDTLVHRDPETLAYGPGLAASWRFPDPLTVDLTLQDGVQFHDGEDFDADDVVATVALLLQRRDDLPVPHLFGWLAGAERLDRLEVRLKLAHPFAPVLEYLSVLLPVLPDRYLAAAGEKGLEKAPVGTGPYRLVRRDGGDLVFERFDRHFSASLKGKPAIRTILVRPIRDENQRLAELLAGGIEWLGDSSRERYEQVRRIPHLQTVSAASLWLGMLALHGDAGQPLADVRVRQAMIHAIDRQKLAQNQLGIDGRALAGPCHPKQVGCETGGVPRYEASPQRARRLLAEAGYPDGITVILSGFGDRGLLEALQSDLAMAGIRATGRPESEDEQPGRLPAGRFQAAFVRWGSFGLMDVAATLEPFLAGDPDLAAAARKAAEEARPDARKSLYGRIVQRMMEQAYVVPLFSQPTRYAFAKGLRFPAFTDAIPRFYMAAWE